MGGISLGIWLKFREEVAFGTLSREWNAFVKNDKKIVSFDVKLVGNTKGEFIDFRNVIFF